MRTEHVQRIRPVNELKVKRTTVLDRSLRGLWDAKWGMLAQTLHLHIGADLHIPVATNRYEPPSRAAQQAEEAARKDPFEGLPLRAWAERLGERVMPAYEVIKEEQAAAKRAAKAMDRKVAELHVPAVPHFLPITKWCGQLSLGTAISFPSDQALRCSATVMLCFIEAAHMVGMAACPASAHPCC